jgi:hypothetical protein
MKPKSEIVAPEPFKDGYGDTPPICKIADVRKWEQDYKRHGKRFTGKLYEFIVSSDSLYTILRRSLKSLENVYFITLYIVLTLTFVNLVSVIIHYIQKGCWSNTNPWLIVLSFLVPFLSFTYMFVMHLYPVKKLVAENRSLCRELKTIFHEGDDIDSRVLKFLPCGMDTDVINSKHPGNFTWKTSRLDSDSWRKVKEFVESPVAKIWCCRMAVKKTLERDNKSLTSPHDKVIDCTGLFMLTPIFFYLFSNTIIGKKSSYIPIAISIHYYRDKVETALERIIKKEKESVEEMYYLSELLSN